MVAGRDLDVNAEVVPDDAHENAGASRFGVTPIAHDIF